MGITVPIYNTPQLTQADVDAMNTGFRSLGYAGNPNGGLITDYEIMGQPAPANPALDYPQRQRGLAEYLHVLPSTVQSWLVPTTQNTFPFPRNIIPAQKGFGANAGRPGAVGQRPYCWHSVNLEGAGDWLNTLRQRVFLCAALAVPGGFQREHIYTGETMQRRDALAMLSECVQLMFELWDGRDTFFIERAWIEFSIDGRPGAWVLTTWYNNQLPGQESDPDDEDEDGIDCTDADEQEG